MAASLWVEAGPASSGDDSGHDSTSPRRRAVAARSRRRGLPTASSRWGRRRFRQPAALKPSGKAVLWATDASDAADAVAASPCVVGGVHPLPLPFFLLRGAEPCGSGHVRGGWRHALVAMCREATLWPEAGARLRGRRQCGEKPMRGCRLPAKFFVATIHAKHGSYSNYCSCAIIVHM